MEELYRSLLGPAGDSVERLADYAEFARWYAGGFRRRDAALAWEEIRSIVKGACLDDGRDLLRRDEYETLGRKRAPLFVAERPRLHEVARRWQEHLRAAGRADEIDLCRRALAAHRARPRAWSHVVCDEAQDLAELQVELLLRLHAGPRLEGLFLAGDPQQVINPSGFRWAEVRTAIRERARGGARPVDITSLRRNFRSVRGVVELANALLALKRERTGRSDGDETEEAAVVGPTPIRVEGGEEELAAAVAGFGPRCAVLVGSEDMRGRLQALLDTTRIFTVQDAKGLEFDVVVLWGLVAADPDPWTRLLDPALDLREDPACRRALHHLYVAVTRARRHLAVHEPPGAPPVWTSRWLGARLDSESSASLARLFVRTATPAGVARRGHVLPRARPPSPGRGVLPPGWRGAARDGVPGLAPRAGGRRRGGGAALAGPRRACAGGPLPREHPARGWRRGACGWRKATWPRRAAARPAPRSAPATGRRPATPGKRSASGRMPPGAGRTAVSVAGSSGASARAPKRSSAGRTPRGTGRRRKPGTERPRAGDARDETTDASRTEAMGHESAGRFADASRAWRAAGNEARARRAGATAAEGDERWADAAALWEDLGEMPAAARAWRRAGRLREAALCEARMHEARGPARARGGSARGRG